MPVVAGGRLLVGPPWIPDTGAWGLLLDIKNFLWSFERWRLGIVNNSLEEYYDTLSQIIFVIIDENHRE